MSRSHLGQWPIAEIELLLKFTFSVLLFAVLYFTRRQQSRLYSALWVDGLPLLIWALTYLSVRYY